MVSYLSQGSSGEVIEVRPFQDILQSEINDYVSVHRLDVFDVQAIPENTIDRVMQDYLDDVQQNFPAVSNTVLSTIKKLQPTTTTDSRCDFCNGPLAEGTKCAACQVLLAPSD